MFMAMGSKMPQSPSRGFGKISQRVKLSRNIILFLFVFVLIFLTACLTSPLLLCAPSSFSWRWGLLASAERWYSHPDSHCQRLLKGQQTGSSASQLEQGWTCGLCLEEGLLSVLLHMMDKMGSLLSIVTLLYILYAGSPEAGYWRPLLPHDRHMGSIWPLQSVWTLQRVICSWGWDRASGKALVVVLLLPVWHLASKLAAAKCLNSLEDNSHLIVPRFGCILGAAEMY